MSGNTFINIPFEWTVVDKINEKKINMSSVKLGSVEYAYSNNYVITLCTETKSFTLYPPNTELGRRQIEAFKLHFPQFPYYRDYYTHETVINIENKLDTIIDHLKNMEARVNTVENKFIDIISHLESIMICIRTRPVDADNMSLDPSGNP